MPLQKPFAFVKNDVKKMMKIAQNIVAQAAQTRQRHASPRAKARPMSASTVTCMIVT